MANNKKNNNTNNVIKIYAKQKDPKSRTFSYLYDAVFRLETPNGIHKMVMNNPDLRERVLIMTYAYYRKRKLPDQAINVLKRHDSAMKAILNKHYKDDQGKYNLKYFLPMKTVLNTYPLNNRKKVKDIVEEAKKERSKISPYANMDSSLNHPA